MEVFLGRGCIPIEHIDLRLRRRRWRLCRSIESRFRRGVLAKVIRSVGGCFRLVVVGRVCLFFGFVWVVCRGVGCFGSIVRSGIGVGLFG